MEVYLLRHGNAQMQWDVDTQPTLSPMGISQARRVGAYLKSLGVKFDTVLTSGILRAEQTADQVIVALGQAPGRLTNEEFTPSGHSHAMQLALESLPDDATVLVVGHLPTIGYLTEALGGESAYTSFDNCTMAHFSYNAGTWEFRNAINVNAMDVI